MDPRPRRYPIFLAGGLSTAILQVTGLVDEIDGGVKRGLATCPGQRRIACPLARARSGDAVRSELRHERDSGGLLQPLSVGDNPANLIVVGNRGLGAKEGQHLGSVPGNVVKNALCDVLVVQTSALDEDRVLGEQLLQPAAGQAGPVTEADPGG